MIAASRCFHNFPLLRCKKPGGGVHCIGSAIIYILWDFLPIIYYAELWMVSTSTPSDLLFAKNDKKMYIAGGSHRDACHFRPNRHHAKMCNKKNMNQNAKMKWICQNRQMFFCAALCMCGWRRFFNLIASYMLLYVSYRKFPAIWENCLLALPGRFALAPMMKHRRMLFAAHHGYWHCHPVQKLNARNSQQESEKSIQQIEAYHFHCSPPAIHFTF